MRLDPVDFVRQVRGWYYSAIWYEVYDFVEWLANFLADPLDKRFSSAINRCMESEQSAYRLVSGIVCPVISPEELSEVDSALVLRDPFGAVSLHIRRSLELYSDRRNPDYRNAVKEAISAIESMAKLITTNKNSTLGEALTVLERSRGLHPALRSGFSSLYGYTNASGGIRHSLIDFDKEPVAEEDARYFIISCSAFVNYLIAKMTKS